MTDFQRQPSSISSRVDELKQFLIPTGISEPHANLLHEVLATMLDLVISGDGRDRRFILMVLTREKDDPPLISTDMIANVPPEVVRDALKEWLARHVV